MAESRDNNGQNFTENQNTGRLEENQAANQARKEGTKAPGKKDQGERKSGLSAWLSNGLSRLKLRVGALILIGYLKYATSRVSSGLKGVLRIGTPKS